MAKKPVFGGTYLIYKCDYDTEAIEETQETEAVVEETQETEAVVEDPTGLWCENSGFYATNPSEPFLD